MDMTTQILSGLFGIAMVILIAPRILAVNQGKILRNIALWVAIFLGLALAYKIIGPGRFEETPPTTIATPGQPGDVSADKDDTNPNVQINEDNGFSPPQGD